jgi:hypothetical protein
MNVISGMLLVSKWYYPFGDLLNSSKSTFQQSGYERSKNLMGAPSFCILDVNKPNIWTVSDLQGHGIIYIHIAKYTQGKHLFFFAGSLANDEVYWALLLKPLKGTRE